MSAEVDGLIEEEGRGGGVTAKTKDGNLTICADVTIGADGKLLHSQYQISVLIDGKPKALNIPAELVDKVREKIEMRRRFDAAAATICRVNLKRFLKEKEERQV